MKFAFCLFKYFPHGGLAHDFIRIVKLCQQRGHVLDVYTMSWQGPKPAGVNVTELAVRGISNHRRALNFAAAMAKVTAVQKYDLVIGFNKMPGLDLYYAADICYALDARRRHGFLYQLAGRYRVFAEMERAVFAPESKTQILYLAEKNRDGYISYYHTPEQRFHQILPEVDAAYFASDDFSSVRQQLRAEYKLTGEQRLILLVGSNFELKGVDRALLALSALPAAELSHTVLWIIGQGDSKRYLKMARKLGVAEHVSFLGTKRSIRDFLFMADLLIHPARREAAGLVLVEAIAASLPVLTTAECGYAHYVTDAGAGIVVPSPFAQQNLNNYLQKMLALSPNVNLRTCAMHYAEEQLKGHDNEIVTILEGVAKSLHN